MRIFQSKFGLALLALLSAGVANADNNFGIGVKAGTLGLGLEASWQPLPYLDVRLGANSYDYDNDGRHAGIDYEATLALESFYGTANFHFPISPMRLTAGVYSNGNEFQLLNDEVQDQSIGGIVYPGAGIGTISSTTSFDSTSPYLGIVDEAWPSGAHITDPMLFYCANGSKETMKANISRMLESVGGFLEMDRIRTVTMSEYFLKS